MSGEQHSINCHPDRNSYNCAQCSREFLTKWHLSKHLRISHSWMRMIERMTEFRYVCQTCGSEFSELVAFNSHSLLVHRKFNCSKCPRSLRCRQNLRKHYLTQHGIGVAQESTNYKCGECGRIFTNLRSFAYHSAIHKPPQYSCNQCDRKFFNLSGAQAHSKSAHLGKKIKNSLNTCEISCDQCALKFQTAGYLKAHLKRIHQPKEHKCPHCYREFGTVAELNCHLLLAHSVNVESNYKCQICHKKCKDQAGLVLHSRFHGNPTYSCGQCPLKFYAAGNLSLHIKRTHTAKFAMPQNTLLKEINYTCAVCCRPFALNQKGLRRHLQIHYFNPQVCPVCQKTFYSERTFGDHIRQRHPNSREKISCSFCNKRFPCQETYLRHRKYHEKPTLTCPDCPLLFYTKMSLQSHSRSHNSKAKSGKAKYLSRRSTFGCVICSRVFPIRCLLLRHINTHNPTAFSCANCHFQCHEKYILSKHLKHFHEAELG